MLSENDEDMVKIRKNKISIVEGDALEVPVKA